MAAVVLYGPNGLPLNPQTPAIVDPTFGALRAVLKPHEYQFPGFTGGHYRAVGMTAAIAPAANAVLCDFFFQPVNNNLVCLIKRIRAQVYVATAVTGQRMDPLVCVMQRNYTAQSVTNATALVLAGHNAKMRTANMGTSIAKIGMASVAAGITGGVKTADANPFGAAPLSGGAILAWYDYRASGGPRGIYAIRLDAEAAIASGWNLSGTPICTTSNPQGHGPLNDLVAVCSDGAGGAFVAWADARNTPVLSTLVYDVFAHHVLFDGSLDPIWPAAGRGLTTGPGYKYPHALIADGERRFLARDRELERHFPNRCHASWLRRHRDPSLDQPLVCESGYRGE